MEMEFAKQVDGTDKGDILIFTLSTCGWCYKTKTLLNQLGVKYTYIDVDLLSPDETEQVNKEMGKYTSRTAFPTVVVNQKDCIVGYDPEKLRDLFEN